MVFQLAPETEAPAEMHMFYPGLRALNLAENATHNLHNIYPIRGAQVRDANAWAKYLNEARDQLRAQGRRGVRAAPLAGVGQRRGCSTISPSSATPTSTCTTRRCGSSTTGSRPAEIAERLALPKPLEKEWHVRGYYGTFSHNAKSVYQRYLGWYDANPANLNPLPPVERARKYVAYMGGAEAAIARAREDFGKGEYRWVAEAMSQVVFAEPDNRAARELGADALEQMGYQAEVRDLAQCLPARRAGAAARQPARRGRRAPEATSCAASRSTCSSISSACASTARRPRARRSWSTGRFPISANAMP